MNFTRTIHAAALVVFLMASAALQAVPTRPGAPSLPAVEAIPQKEGTLLEKDYRREQHAWQSRLLLAPASKRWQGEAWAQEAAALLEEAFALLEQEYRVTQPLAPLAGRFRDMLGKAPEEPLLLVFGALALYSEQEDWRQSRKLLEQALSRGEMNGALEAIAVQARKIVGDREGINTDSLQERWLAALGRGLEDGSYDEASQVVLLRHHLIALNGTEFSTPQPLDHYVSQIQNSTLPEWIKLTLRGAAQKNLAWVKRSSGWAQEVSDAQWQGFAEHLKVARDLLGQAARLRPDRPEAPSAMIVVATGENVDPSELRAWFDRAVSAQFDYEPAYKALLWAYRPRWAGSFELMLAFGKACADTKRYDTMVPSRLMAAAIDVVSEVYDAPRVFRVPGVKESMAEMSRGYLEHSAAKPPLTRHLLQSNAAMCAWLADDDALAQQALAAAGPRLARNTRLMLSSMLMHEAFLRAEVKADTGAFGEAVRAAANPAPDTALEQIHAAFMKVEDKGLSPEALAYVQEARFLTGVKQAVDAGGWVAVPFYPHLTAFFQSEEGEWTVDADGTLVCHGTDHPRSRLVLRVPLEADLEMKGEIAFDVPATVETSQFGCGFGPVMHWLPSSPAGLRVLLGHLDPQSACVKAFSASMNNSTPDIHFPQKEWNTFSVRIAGGKLTYDVNERTMATKHDLAQLGLENESGMLGFSAYRLALGAKARVRNVSIRKITTADLEPLAAAEPGIGASLPAGQFAWIWKASILGVLALGGIFGPRLIRSQQDDD